MVLHLTAKLAFRKAQANDATMSKSHFGGDFLEARCSPRLFMPGRWGGSVLGVALASENTDSDKNGAVAMTAIDVLAFLMRPGRCIRPRTSMSCAKGVEQVILETAVGRSFWNEDGFAQFPHSCTVGA